jgi:hypothetical protein
MSSLLLLSSSFQQWISFSSMFLDRPCCCPSATTTLDWLSKSKLLYDRQPVSVSRCRAPLFYFFLLFDWKIALLFVLGRPLWREDGSVICSAICQWSESQRTHNHTLLSHLRLLGSPFCHLLWLAGITVEVFLPASTWGWLTVSICFAYNISTWAARKPIPLLLSHCLLGFPFISVTNCSRGDMLVYGAIT